MPYIKKENRANLDLYAEQLANRIKANSGSNVGELTNEQFLSIAGDINYCFTRISLILIGETSYSKIAVITGVLENIKQELYRRVASNYEDQKIKESGDVVEFAKMPVVGPR